MRSTRDLSLDWKTRGRLRSLERELGTALAREEKLNRDLKTCREVVEQVDAEGQNYKEYLRIAGIELALAQSKLARAVEILKDLAGDYGPGSATRNTIFDFLEEK